MGQIWFPVLSDFFPHGAVAKKYGVWISAIDVLFSDHPKCLDLIFIYLSGLMISIENLRLLKHTSVADKQVKEIISFLPLPSETGLLSEACLQLVITGSFPS
jgi:hypothetical protein